MFKKVCKRIIDKQGALNAQENKRWIEQQSVSFETIANAIDPHLWKESVAVSDDIEKRAADILSHIPYDLGGGGVYPFLYFATRILKPSIIVETGVTAGFSSYAFLRAIQRNGIGKLYSSDFPLFRLPNPENYIGVVVDDALKKHWNLHIEGDEMNLPRILNEIETIDIFHFDSDKSYSGRKFALDIISKKMHPKSVIFMDDIQDNAFFYDYVQKMKPAHWSVTFFNSKNTLGSLVKLVCNYMYENRMQRELSFKTFAHCAFF